MLIAIRFLENNCPIGVSDGRIPDSDFKSSSVFNNESAVYGPQFGRLDHQPDETNIGAWRPYEGKFVRFMAKLICPK